MFPYTVRYTESEYDIQINDLLYKIHRKHQNTFVFLDYGGKFRKVLKNQLFLFCYLYKLHSSYFVIFGMFVVLGFLYFFVFLYLYILHV